MKTFACDDLYIDGKRDKTDECAEDAGAKMKEC